jgi:hypothetical protein
LRRLLAYATVPKRTNETLPRDDCQQTLDARYQGPRPLALARLTVSLPAWPDQSLYAFDSLATPPWSGPAPRFQWAQAGDNAKGMNECQ